MRWHIFRKHGHWWVSFRGTTFCHTIEPSDLRRAFFGEAL